MQGISIVEVAASAKQLANAHLLLLLFSDHVVILQDGSASFFERLQQRQYLALRESSRETAL